MEDFKKVAWECDFRTHPKYAHLEGVLIETRPDYEGLRYALTNFSCHLPYLSLTVLGSKENFGMIREIIGNDTNIQILEFAIEPPFTIQKFNKAVCSPSFWDQFHGDRVLFFMTDTGVRRNDALRFMQYDWVGSPWEHYVHFVDGKGDDRVFQGNGAFSIRNPRKLKALCEVVHNNGEISEDVFFACHLAVTCTDAWLPIRDVAEHFSMEGTFYSETFGFHNAPVVGHFDNNKRKLFNLWSANIDGRDIANFIRLGIGSTCLRIGEGTYLGGSVLSINGIQVQLKNGVVADTLEFFPND